MVQGLLTLQSSQMLGEEELDGVVIEVGTLLEELLRFCHCRKLTHPITISTFSLPLTTASFPSISPPQS